MTKLLSAQEVERFRRDGYLFPYRAISEAKAADSLRQLADYEATLGHEAQNHVRFKFHLVFNWALEIARNETILDAVEDLIGPDILLFAGSIWTKNAHDPRFVAWHQDSAYFGLDPHDEVTAWVAISDSRSDNGCLRYLPQSHHGADMTHIEKKGDNNLLVFGQRIEGIADERGIDAELAPGEFTLHHERTAHSSRPNVSDRRRVGLSLFYIPAHVRSTGARRSALLVRGKDKYGHWDPDPLPRYDLDPITFEHMKKCLGGYLHG
ncbi:MAG: phytanoyl-CoA dioxygenase family protein [Alphaproteobacteria bacterium]|nr:phytanoyl-CoA dioxygenase family protein [Alphaproteobacteria bacterium]